MTVDLWDLEEGHWYFNQRNEPIKVRHIVILADQKEWNGGVYNCRVNGIWMKGDGTALYPGESIKEIIDDRVFIRVLELEEEVRRLRREIDSMWEERAGEDL